MRTAHMHAHAEHLRQMRIKMATAQIASIASLYIIRDFITLVRELSTYFRR